MKRFILTTVFAAITCAVALDLAHVEHSFLENDGDIGDVAPRIDTQNVDDDRMLPRRRNAEIYDGNGVEPRLFDDDDGRRKDHQTVIRSAYEDQLASVKNDGNLRVGDGNEKNNETHAKNPEYEQLPSSAEPLLDNYKGNLENSSEKNGMVYTTVDAPSLVRESVGFKAMGHETKTPVIKTTTVDNVHGLGRVPNTNNGDNISIDISQKINLETHVDVSNIKPLSALIIKPEFTKPQNASMNSRTMTEIIPEEFYIDKAENSSLNDSNAGKRPVVSQVAGSSFSVNETVGGSDIASINFDHTLPVTNYTVLVADISTKPTKIFKPYPMAQNHLPSTSKISSPSNVLEEHIPNVDGAPIGTASNNTERVPMLPEYQSNFPVDNRNGYESSKVADFPHTSTSSVNERNFSEAIKNNIIENFPSGLTTTAIVSSELPVPELE